MKTRRTIYAALVLILIFIMIFTACSPIREFSTLPEYQGKNEFNYNKPLHDPERKTVVLVADNDGTEIFDLLAPFYLFNETEKANVYIAAQEKQPVTAMKGIFLLPHFTYVEMELAGIRPDVIVIPNLSAMDAESQDPEIINWVKKNYTDSTKILAVCDGSLTAAETGLYDGKPITTHASDIKMLKKENDKPQWVKNRRVTRSGNLYSTAGVSNAVEGSLVVIEDMFGPETMSIVKENIHYPHATPKIEHNSEAINFSNKLTILNKVLFKGNKKIGVLLQDDINELELAAVMDTYNRVFPKSIESFGPNDAIVTTKHGLTLIPTGNSQISKPDELHVLDPSWISIEDLESFGKPELVTYDHKQEEYIFDFSLKRIDSLYGKNYGKIVKLLLDYN